MLTINVKLLETVSRGGPARTKACCPDSVYSIGALNHYFSDRKSAIGHFACKMYFLRLNDSCLALLKCSYTHLFSVKACL